MITLIGSLKGGSGKSTLTFNLAVWLTMAEVGVRLVDADPQATLSDVMEVRREEGFEPLPRAEQREVFAPGEWSAEEEILIDTGTANMSAMREALALCDRVVVPVQPSQADIWSVQRFLKLVAEVERPSPPEVLGFINRADTHHAVRESDEAAAALMALSGIRFVRARLAQRTIFRRSFSEGLAVFELEPRGKAAREFLALAAALYPHLVS